MRRFLVAWAWGLMALWALNAHALTPEVSLSANESARLALKEGDYGQVVALTKEIAKAEPVSALNWYRMAIAASKTGDYPLALRALDAAESADPSKSFASSPGRVKSLRNDISTGIAKAGFEADPAALTPPTQTMTVAMQGQFDQISAGIAKLTSQQSQSAAEARAAGAAANTTLATWIVGFALLSLACLAALAWSSHRWVRQARESQLRKAGALPLQDLIRLERDVTALLVQRLALHGHTGTELSVQLQKALPALERESGRAAMNLEALTAGVALADAPHKLNPRPMVLGKAEPAKIHLQAAEAARSAQRLAA